MKNAKAEGYANRIKGVFATMISIKNERLIPILETATGPRLFSIIVDDSETAKRIIDFNKN